MIRLNRRISRLSPIPLIFMVAFFCVFYMFYTYVPNSKEETNEVVAREIPKEIVDLHIRKPKSQESPLFIFDSTDHVVCSRILIYEKYISDYYIGSNCYFLSVINHMRVVMICFDYVNKCLTCMSFIDMITFDFVKKIK